MKYAASGWHAWAWSRTSREGNSTKARRRFPITVCPRDSARPFGLSAPTCCSRRRTSPRIRFWLPAPARTKARRRRNQSRYRVGPDRSARPPSGRRHAPTEGARDPGRAAGAGLSDLAAGRVKPSAAVRKSSVPDLWILPSGAMPPDPTELLSSPQFRQFIETLAKFV